MDENNPIGAVVSNTASCPKGTRVRYTIVERDVSPDGRL
jgi:hypothetical protein